MLRHFLRDQKASAAEFALILPLAIVILFAIIDGGRYLWDVNRAEKATQAGARIAAVTEMVPQGVADYAYAIDSNLPQGEPVGEDDFPGVECSGTASAVSCNWIGTPNDAFDLVPDSAAATAAFNQVLERMQHFMPDLEPENVVIRYSNGGLGFAGDPVGPDVAPLITVRLQNVEFRPILTSFFGLNWGVPSAPYTISQEDGSGVCFEEYDDVDCELG